MSIKACAKLLFAILCKTNCKLYCSKAHGRTTYHECGARRLHHQLIPISQLQATRKYNARNQRALQHRSQNDRKFKLWFFPIRLPRRGNIRFSRDHAILVLHGTAIFARHHSCGAKYVILRHNRTRQYAVHVGVPRWVTRFFFFSFKRATTIESG